MPTQNTFTSGYYEQDPRWSAVDAYTTTHLHPTSRPNHAALVHALEQSREHGLPDISAFQTMAKFLALQCGLGGYKHALEGGTLGGYTAIWLASENPELHITSIEFNPKHADVARQNIAFAGLSERVEIIEGSALAVLAKLLAEVEEGKRARFGFTFIDADWTNRAVYFDFAVKMSVARACICVDNMVVRGTIVSPEAQSDEGVQGARQLVEEAGRDQRVDAVVLQTVGEKDYDGFLFAVVR